MHVSYNEWILAIYFWTFQGEIIQVFTVLFLYTLSLGCIFMQIFPCSAIKVHLLPLGEVDAVSDLEFPYHHLFYNVSSKF